MLRSRKLLLTGVALFVPALAAGLFFAQKHLLEEGPAYPPKVMKHANELQERILSFDSHINVPIDYGTPGSEADKDSGTQFDLPKAARGRLSGAALTVFAWPELWNGPNAPHRPTPAFLPEAQKEQETRYRIITGIARDFPNQAAIAYTPDDFRRLAGEGKFAIVISMLNAYPLGNDISRLDQWAARGMRIFGFSYVANNDWADSSRPMPFYNDTPDALGGLSDIGRQAVTRLNELGVVIDVSQMSRKAVEEVTRLTRAPVIASHSAVRGLVDIDRNLSDQELKAIKDTGGVVQVVAFPTYLKPLSQETRGRLNELRAQHGLQPLENLNQALMPADPVIAIWPEQKFGEYAGALYGILEEEPKATLKDYVDAIDYTVKKVGIDHVGISSDFNDGGGVVGWENASEARNVTAELITRGYSDQDIAKLWGGNFLRVWGEVQKLSTVAAHP